MLNSRVRSLVSPTEEATFKNSIRLFTIWDHVDKYNIAKLKQLNLPVAKIKAVHSGTGARNAPSETTNGLEPVLFLSNGARIMLISNLWTNQGLVNGAMGTIIDIMYELGMSPPTLPTITIKVQHYPYQIIIK